jgi:transcriptional regulator with XRE-family HTH domain
MASAFRSFTPGGKLRACRLNAHLTLRQVSLAANRIAEAYENDLFLISTTRLSDIERDLTVPSIHKLFALAKIYSVAADDVFAWYGIPGELRCTFHGDTTP